MTARRVLISLWCLSPWLIGCSKRKPESAPAQTVAPIARAPRFYYDLGPATVDVSGYPERQRENYKLFLAVCGTCHSTARPLNAPYSGADAWKRFVRRMHVKMESRAVLPSPEDEERILEFLVYDSEVRKNDKNEAFQSQQEKLKKLFAETHRQ